MNAAIPPPRRRWRRPRYGIAICATYCLLLGTAELGFALAYHSIFMAACAGFCIAIGVHLLPHPSTITRALRRKHPRWRR